MSYKSSVIFVFIFFSFALVSSSSQILNINTLSSSGLTINARPAQGSNYGSDSLHYLGRIELYKIDSVQFKLSCQDSLNAALIGRVYHKYKTSDTATIIPIAVAGGQMRSANAANVFSFGWFSLVSALKPNDIAAYSIDLYLRIYAVGTEVAASGKKVHLTAKIYN
jgi:hypothetical protein